MSVSASPQGSGPCETDGLPARQRQLALASLSLAIILSTLSTTSISLGLPIMAVDLGIEPADSLWIVNAMQLSLLVSLLPFAALGELWGYKRTCFIGLGLLAAGSLASALAPTFELLLAARVVQGIGGAAVFSVNSALFRLSVPASRLGHAIGISAMAGAVGTAMGPTVAAIVLSVAPWPWLFAINIPLALISLLLGAWSLPTERARAGERFDFVGASLNVAAFGLVFLGLDGLVNRGWLGAPVLLAGVVFGFLLVRHQRHLKAPLLPLDLMRLPIVRIAAVASSFAFAAQLGALVALPFLLHAQMGKTTGETGILITTWPIFVGLTAPLTARFLLRVSSAQLCGLGCGLMAVGLAVLAWLPAAAPNAAFAFFLGLCGFGFGCFQAPNNRVLLEASPRERSGGAGGLQSTARLIGQTFGASVTAIAFQLTGAKAPMVTLLACAAMAVLAAGLSLSRGAAAKTTGADATAP